MGYFIDALAADIILKYLYVLPIVSPEKNQKNIIGYTRSSYHGYI